jgi:hypothetical protein
MAQLLYQQTSLKLKSGNRNTRLGDIILESQNLMPQSTGYKDVLMSWNFIGDPSTKLPEQAFSEPDPESLNREPASVVSPSSPNAKHVQSSGGCDLMASTAPAKKKGSIQDFILNAALEFLYLFIIPVILLLFRRKNLYNK